MRTRHILIVEDDAAIVESLTDALTDEGYTITSARDGVEAMAVLRAGLEPSLILLDWMMPRCDGPCFRRQQQADANLAHIPVVVLTADIAAQQRKAELEASAYLKKPVALDELLRTIETHLG
jgi:CheY-like chemotaxis protein